MKKVLKSSLVFLLVFFNASNCSLVRQIRIIKSGQIDQPLTQVISVPFQRYGHLLVVEASLNHNPKKYTFILDTGAATVVIDPSVAKELNVPEITRVKAHGTTGAKIVPMGLLKNFQIAKNLSMTDVGVVLIDMDIIKRNITGRKIDGYWE